MFRPYRASGKCGTRFFALLPLAAGVMCGLGWLHGLVMATGKGRPIGMSLVLMVLGAGCITCYLTVSLGKCRNRLVSVVAGVMLGALVMASAHAFHYARAPDGAKAGATVAAWFEAQAAAGVPMPGARRTKLQGWEAWVRWGVELAAVVAFFGYVGADTSKTPFCERCGTEHDVQKRVCEWSSPSPALMGVARRCRSIAELDIPSAHDGAPATRWLVLVGRSCRCGEVQTLTIVREDATTRRDKEGEGSSKLFRTSEVLRENEVMDEDDIAHFALICEALDSEVSDNPRGV